MDMPMYQTDHLTGEIETSLMDNRIIMVTEEITPSIAKTVIGKILYLEAKSDDPIKIYISSPGGCVNDGLAIIDAMELSTCEINTVAIGDCCSMAAIILSCGKNRKIYPHAHVMYHQLSGMSWGKMDDIEVNYKLSRELQDTLEEIFKKHTKVTPAQLKEWGSKDTWLTAKDAVSLGVVDEILVKK